MSRNAVPAVNSSTGLLYDDYGPREPARVETAGVCRMLHLVSTCLYHGRMPMGSKSAWLSDPDVAALEELLLPDGDDLLDAVHTEVAGLERFLAMRRRYGDHQAGFADLHPAQPVRDRDAGLGPSVLAHLCRDLLQLLIGHWAIRLVLQGEHPAPGGVVACRADEDDYRARAGMVDPRLDVGGVKLVMT